MLQKCVGVQWIEENYGPLGVAGGSLCYFIWTMPPGWGVPTSGYDIAQLQSQFLQVTTVISLNGGASDN